MADGRKQRYYVKSEIHNVLTVMRLSDAYARESELYADFRSLLDELHNSSDLVDAQTVVEPFLALVATSRAEEVADVALSSVHTFLLYGLISSSSINAREAVNLIVRTLCGLDEGRFWAESELGTTRVLEALLATLRSTAGHLLSNRSVWHIWCTALQASLPARGQSAPLRHAAESAMAVLTLTVFARLPHCVETAWEEWEPSDGADGAAAAAAAAAAADGQNGVDAGVAPAPALPPPPPPGANASPPPPRAQAQPSAGADGRRVDPADEVYGVPCMCWLLGGLARLIDPQWHGANARSQQLGLRLVNTALEAGGDGFSAAPPLVALIQESVCKHLLHAAHTADALLLSLALRAVFNLFVTVRQHLKTELEVFFNSMHMRLLAPQRLKPDAAGAALDGAKPNNAHASAGASALARGGGGGGPGGALGLIGAAATVEQQQLTVESLVEFCREPALLVDLYVNYDCDVGCTNLFENLARLLARAAIPASENATAMAPSRAGGLGGGGSGGSAAGGGGGGGIGSAAATAALLQPACFEGFVAVLDSLARLCGGGGGVDAREVTRADGCVGVSGGGEDEAELDEAGGAFGRAIDHADSQCGDSFSVQASPLPSLATSPTARAPPSARVPADDGDGAFVPRAGAPGPQRPSLAVALPGERGDGAPIAAESPARADDVAPRLSLIHI